MTRFLMLVVFVGASAWGQTLVEAQRELKSQEAALGSTFGEYMRLQAETFAEKTKDRKGDRTVAFTSQLEKTHEVWLNWAHLEARDQVAPEPVGRQEILYLMAKAWLFEKKSSALRAEMGGPDSVNQPVIDDTRVDIGPVGNGFDLYAGEVGGSKGLFALQWLDEKRVRGGFASNDGLQTFRVFGDSSVNGVIEFLFVKAGADKGMEAKLEKVVKDSGEVWSGESAVLGVVKMERIPLVDDVEEPEKVTKSSYEGRSGRTRLAIQLEWRPSDRVTGQWTDFRSGVPSDLDGLNYAEGQLFLNRWEGGGPGVAGAKVRAMWFLAKKGTNPVTWKGTAIYLNGFEEEVSFSK